MRVGSVHADVPHGPLLKSKAISPNSNIWNELFVVPAAQPGASGVNAVTDDSNAPIEVVLITSPVLADRVAPTNVGEVLNVQPAVTDEPPLHVFAPSCVASVDVPAD